MATQLWSIALMVIASLFSASGSVYLKIGSKHVGFNILMLIRNKPLILGIMLHVFSAGFNITALRGGELSVLVPIAALNYVWASMLAIRYLGEKMNKWKWLGTITIVVGLALIGISGAL